MDWGAWQATVYRVTKSRIWLRTNIHAYSIIFIFSSLFLLLVNTDTIHLITLAGPWVVMIFKPGWSQTLGSPVWIGYPIVLGCNWVSYFASNKEETRNFLTRKLNEFILWRGTESRIERQQEIKRRARKGGENRQHPVSPWEEPPHTHPGLVLSC